MSGSGLGWEVDQYSTRWGACGTCGARWETCRCHERRYDMPEPEELTEAKSDWAPSDEYE